MPITYLNKIISKEAEKFIEENNSLTAHEILLKFSGKTELPLKEICEQIEASKKAKLKLPKLSDTKLIYMKTPLEQCSSELAASYKSKKIKGKRIIDLTGGLGIDTIFFSKQFDEVYYYEQNNELAEIAAYNFNQLGIKNITVICGDSISELSKFKNNYFDWIYADPSRRSNEKRSVDIAFYSPDILGNINLLFSKSPNILLKLAPAFDIKEAEKIFPQMSSFSVMSIGNECKEVLISLSKKNEEKTKTAVLLKDGFSSIEFTDKINDQYKVKSDFPKKDFYFYEPDTAIRKVGLTDKIAHEENFSRINKISDYLISEKYVENFPGRKFKILCTETYNEKKIKKYISEEKLTTANIARSNFPDKPEQIKKKLKLKDGGENYLFFTKNIDDKLIFLSTIKYR